MKTLETTIEIKGSVNEVWNVLMNHSEYSKWNPFITQLNGSTIPGEQLDVIIALENKKPMNFKPKVLKNEAQSEFRWLGHLFVKGIFDGEHYFKVERIDDKTTLFTHGESFTGVFVPVLLKMIGDDTKQGFEKMNKALKNKVESN